MNNKRLSKKQYIYLILSVIFIGFLVEKMNNVVVVLTPSIEPSLLIKTNDEVKKGDYILFDIQHDLISSKTVQLTKKVACIAGDKLTTVDTIHFYCNGNPIGTAREYDLSGNTKLPVFKFNDGVIPDGHAFVQGSHFASFDSRNWGFVKLSESTKLKVLI